MATLQFESFALPEIDTEVLSPDMCDARLALIQELELKGQSDILAKSPDSKPHPFPIATRRQLCVIKTLCPERTDLKSYRSEHLPIRVLELAKLAKPHFACLSVYHPTDVRDDPFLLGGDNYYSNVQHLICRWGSHLKSWSELEADYMKVARETLARVKGEVLALETACKSPDFFLLSDNDSCVKLSPRDIRYYLFN
jgi:hypothetical protein